MTLEQCPCTGKNMSNLTAPWILLTLYQSQGVHGYEICKIIRQRLAQLGLGLNIAGLYRHLNGLEKRGMLSSCWDTEAAGPARRKYFMTEQGEACLARWMGTLSTQMTLIGHFFEQARPMFPDKPFPRIDAGFPVDCEEKRDAR